jgi:hypothetical protein
LGSVVVNTLRDVGRKNIGKAQFFLKATKDTKKDIMGAINVDVLIGENQISYPRINGSGNDFINNLYDLGLSMYDN